MIGFCEYCRFYGIQSQDYGHCRRYAPQPTDRLRVEEHDSCERPRVQWPVVWAEDYCGEFVARKIRT